MLRNRRVWTTMAVVLIVAMLLSSCAPKPTPTPTPQPKPTAAPPTTVPPTAAPPEKLKVAFVYVAPIGDMGWTYAHDQGRLMVEQKFGDKVETAYIENVPEGPDAERVIRDFAQKGYDLIITTSFGFMDPTATVAAEFPKTWFVHISGYKTADNLSTVFGKIEEPRYVSGLVAGKMTKSNKLGYVAAFPIPEVIRGINAFTLGVRKANPNATVTVVWTSTWFDPVKEKEAAEALLDQGCDVIAQHQDTPEPQKAAEERGKFGVGYDSDMSKQAPKAVLTSPIWNWGIKYIDIVQRAMDGTYATESFWGGWKDGVVDMAPIGPMVPADVKTMAEAEVAKFKSGQQDIFTIFTGPIKDQNGNLAVGPGQVLSADDLLANMTWFVEGVVGTAPGPVPTPAATTQQQLKAAFIYVGPVGDMGWSYAHDQGRKAMEQNLPYVETTYVEAVPEGPDAERVIRDLATKGYNVIFATSFGYMDPVIAVAKDFPQVIFEHCTGYQTAANVGIYDGRGYQGWYLAGIVAGKMTKKNVLGYVAPYPIPEVVRNMNAFALGARSVNPSVRVHVVWINAWFDPIKEREAATALIDQGVDVLARESDSAEPDKLCEQEGIYAIGYNSDPGPLAPKAVLTAPIWDWGIYYTQVMQAVSKGTWNNAPYWGSMMDGILKLAPFGAMVPNDVRQLVEAKQKEIIAGTFDVFVGPIKDNTGTERVAAGVTMSDPDKLSFDWLVEGVVGSIPK